MMCVYYVAMGVLFVIVLEETIKGVMECNEADI